MKTVFIRVLCIVFAMPALYSPLFSQCSVTISGDLCTGNTLRANFTGGTPDTLKWKLNGNVVHIETRHDFNQNGITVAGGNGAGNALNQLSNPHDVFVDNAGNLFVSELGNARVTKWAPGATLGTIVATTAGEPAGVHVDASGNVYAAERSSHQVTKWAPGAISGVVVAGGNGAGDALNQLNVANDVYVDDNGNIFVADRFNHRIMKWAPAAASGVIVAGGNGPGSALNQLNSPTYTGLDAAGNLYVSDRENNRVLKFPPGSNAGTNGVVVAGGHGPGNSLSQIDGAEGLFVTLDGTVYVTSEDNARIMKWVPGSTTGAIVAGGHGTGSLPNQFYVAVGVCLDAQGNMYVGDAYNNRVQKFIASTGVVTTFIPELAGTYTVTAVSAEGCEATSDAVIVKTTCAEGSTHKIVFKPTGKDQFWTVPPGVTKIKVKLWGAGGAGNNYGTADSSQKGGGGGFAGAMLSVVPGEKLTIIAGSGGLTGAGPGAYGGGGGKACGPGGRGGGRSAIRNAAGDELITAGAGGGGGDFSLDANSGNGGGGLTGAPSHWLPLSSTLGS